jgi:seryl-tRNA synthetase
MNTTTIETSERIESEENNHSKIPKRSERRVRLTLKDGTEIDCSIMNTIMWIKQKFKEIVRRQQIISSKLAGIEDRRKTLHDDLTKASSENDKSAAEIEKHLEELYKEVSTLEDQNRKMNYDLAAICVRFPVVKDKQISKDDIHWEFCDESEVLQAQTFFLLA